MFISLNTKLSD